LPLAAETTGNDLVISTVLGKYEGINREIGLATRNVMLCNKKRDGKPFMVPI